MIPIPLPSGGGFLFCFSCCIPQSGNGHRIFPSRATGSDKAYPCPGPIILHGASRRDAMEQEIYVDILVFLNTVINFFLIMMTAALAGREKRIGRILAAAFLGGIYALILLLPQLSGPVLTLTRVAAARGHDMGCLSGAVSAHVFIPVGPAVSGRIFICRRNDSGMVLFLAAGYALWKRSCLFSYSGNVACIRRNGGLRGGMAVCSPQDTSIRQRARAGANRNRWQAGLLVGGGGYR